MIKLRGSSIPTIVLELWFFSFVSYHAKLTDGVIMSCCDSTCDAVMV